MTEIIASKIPFYPRRLPIVEEVFSWPGMGRMALQAAKDRDFPVIMGIAILAAVFVRMGSLFQSVVYVMVNPRASKESEQRAEGRGQRVEIVRVFLCAMRHALSPCCTFL